MNTFEEESIRRSAVTSFVSDTGCPKCEIDRLKKELDYSNRVKSNHSITIDNMQRVQTRLKNQMKKLKDKEQPTERKGG